MPGTGQCVGCRLSVNTGRYLAIRISSYQHVKKGDGVVSSDLARRASRRPTVWTTTFGENTFKIHLIFYSATCLTMATQQAFLQVSQSG